MAPTKNNNIPKSVPLKRKALPILIHRGYILILNVGLVSFVDFIFLLKLFWFDIVSLLSSVCLRMNPHKTLSIIKQVVQLAVAFVMKDAIAKGGILGLVIAPALGAAASALLGAGINAVSPPSLASGGIATGRSLVEVGEYSGANVNPEVIAPLDKLKSMMGGGMNNINLKGDFEIRGDKLVMLIDRTRQQQSRI